MSHFHRPFRAQHVGASSSPATPATPATPDTQQTPQELIDPNVYGPFGHEYHHTCVHSSHAVASQPASSWHNVETTDQHRRDLQAASHETVIPLQPIGTTHSVSDSSQADFVTHAEPMAIDYTQDTRYTLRSSMEKPHSHSHSPSHLHLRRRSRGLHQHSRAGSLFDIVHGRERSKPSDKPHVEVHGDDVPITLRHLLKRPLIRQWLHGNKLYREKDERKPSQFELVFDLIFVAVVNKLGHATAESSSAINAFKFVLSFWPCFSIWTDVRLFLNTSGTDDMLERLLLLGWMILLSGYCANVSAVQIVKATPELLAKLHGQEALGQAPEQLENHSIVANLESIFRRAASAASAADASESVELAVPAYQDYWFTNGYDRAIHAAIGFFLVAKLWRLGIYIYYGFCLPKFRKALWLNALALFVIAAIYIPITMTGDPLLIVILLSTGIFVELARAYVVAAAIKLFHGRQKRTGNHMFIPAQSHEHSIERYVLFVILIVGESIISSNFTAGLGHYGVNDEFGRAALGITISVLVIWIYYDADGSRVYQHALRRNSFTSITFSHIHYPLTAALVLMATALSSLISRNEIKGGYAWYFGGSASCVLVCLGLIGCLHRNLDVHASRIVPRWVVIALRFGLAVEFALLPLRGDWDSLSLMSIVGGSLGFLVLFETLGKIGAVGRRFDAQKTIEMYADMDARGEKQLKLDKRASWHPFDDLTAGERGEEDVGIESEIGHLEQRDLTHGQRWAYAA
ncbi:uncharacterized protein UMAG_11048 [Mycosarcoma maydis]|uniref:Low temperature requirement A n=1 Tax=Mycosarcoma maydis TaxID=5270 RepID=A0A0D1DUK7_MYCMD|nr:uncharacterized protein UMAG_11048 [Ustilago maydis 521]KIS67964.1 hypothetical protein UMAG_11048 [Ustilago maydis 521]|eukprot:XP_011390531.1 hypothetical protein UMAG_11048 [Ustilago maydis 521]